MAVQYLLSKLSFFLETWPAADLVQFLFVYKMTAMATTDLIQTDEKLNFLHYRLNKDVIK